MTTSVSKVSATLALTLLVCINLFNYIDRQVLAAVEPEIRKELLPEPSDQERKADEPVEESEDAKSWMGLLATAFLLSYMLTAPIFGMLADRVSRWWLIGFGVLVWTIASGASGIDWVGGGVSLASAYWILLLTRCFVGVGEGAYGPVAPAMIADLFPVEKRGKVMAWFYLAIPVGGALGYSLGAIMVKLQNWHWAFYSVVPPGIALGIWCFLMRDPPRGQTDEVAAAPPHKPRLVDYLNLLKIPSFTFNTLGMTMMTFAIGGLAFWMPGFLKQHGEPPLFGVNARMAFGIMTAVAGLISTLAGGLAGDWLRPRFSGSYFLVSGFALALGFPMMLGVVWVPFPMKWVFIFLTVFLLFFNTGPTNTILANVTHPSVRASAFALNILIIHTFGDAISPWLIGKISGRENFDRGFLVMGVAMLIGGVLWFMGAKYLKRDTDLAPTRGPA